MTSGFPIYCDEPDLQTKQSKAREYSIQNNKDGEEKEARSGELSRKLIKPRSLQTI
jgi:hypothetical protein